MTIVQGGMTTVGTGGDFQRIPTVLVMTLADDGTGTSFTATVAGDDDATNYVKYRLTSDAPSWSDGGNRSGDGAIQVTGLTNGLRYEAYAYSVAENIYGPPSAILRITVSDSGAAKTQTLAEKCWKNKRQYEIRTLQADTIERWYKVRLLEWDTRKPTVGDEYYNDTNQVVARVRQVPLGPAADTAYMVVTYIDVSDGGWTNSYAETRRLKHEGTLRTEYVIYGIAKAADSAGIPAVDDLLDGSVTWTDPRCVAVTLDDKTYPGLQVVTSRWTKPNLY